METVEIYGTEEIESRIRTLESHDIADFNREWAGDTRSIIARAWCSEVKIEFVNTAVEDELKDEYWDMDSRSNADYIRSH